jgi:hypothetical protein
MTVVVPYNGYQMLVKPPDGAPTVPFGVGVDVEEFQGDAGSSIQHMLGGLPNESRTHTFSFATRAEFEEFESFLRTIAMGRWGAFWMPSWADDLMVLSGDMFSLLVKGNSYTNKIAPSLSFRHLIVQRFSNPLDFWGRYLTPAGCVDNGDGTETLQGTIDFPYNLNYANLPSAAGHRHMFLHLCRLEEDDVTIDYIGREEVEVTLKMITLPEEAP